MEKNDPNPFDGTRIATGRYFYGEVDKEIAVVRYPFDYHVELFDPGGREGTPTHPLNSDGYLFYLVPRETEPLPEPFFTPEAAMDWADRQPWGPVEWHRLD
jgi:hypothetical protein